MEIRFLAPQGLASLLAEAKGLLSHRLSGASLAEVIQYLAEAGVEKLKKERFGVGSQVEKSEASSDTDTDVKKDSGVEDLDQTKRDIIDDDIGVDAVKSELVLPRRSRYIPKNIRSSVYRRAQGKCEYTDLNTGKRCNSTKFLELDHLTAFARGGTHSVEGISLRCRAHNLLHAEADFTTQWMDQFRKKQS